MDRERLTRLLEDPARAGREDLADLRAMAERYPWFSGAQPLLAVGEHASGDMLFDERLKGTAAHLPSRAMLFDAVHAPAPAPLTIVRDEPVRIAPEKTTIVRPHTTLPPASPSPAPIVQEPIAPAEIPVDEVAVPPAQKQVPVTDAPPQAPVIEERPVAVDTTAPPAPVEKPVPPQAAAADPLDLQILRSALANSYDLLRDVPPLPPPAERLAPPPAATAPLAVPVAPTPPPASQAPPPMATRLRFTDWLEHGAPEDPPSMPPPSTPPAPAVLDWLRADGPAAPAPPVSPAPAPDTSKDIIDRFIQGTVPPPPKKVEFFTPQQAAKKSLEDDGLVSETLARIHAKQGNITKAIEAYQRLALKHPEKSAYFAALSKALEGGPNK